MREYRILFNFKYKNEPYVALIDKQNKYFFLKNNNGNLSYIPYDDFVEISKIFIDTPRIMNARKDGQKLGLVPKILIGGVAVPLTVITLLFGKATLNEVSKNFRPSDYNIVAQLQNEQQTPYEDMDKYDELGNVSDIKNKLSFEVVDSDEELVVDTFLDSEYSKYIYVYDNDYLGRILNYDSVSEQQLHDILDQNKYIPNRFKVLIHEFITDYVTKQPNAERRILYENLKTLKIVECDDRDLLLATLSSDSYACYIRTENTIYVHKDYEYKKGTWEYQVIYHELCHAARTGFWDTKDKQIRVQCEGLNFYTVTSAEALNSIFAVSLFDYNEKDIAYQFQSNLVSIMLDCMDNYEITDYMNHSLGYFANKLDEHNGDNNYAASILQLMEAQFDDYHSDRIEIEQTEYYPLYDYVSDMHYRKYITPDMSYEEARSVVDKMVETIMFDVPEEYNIDTNRFYEYLDEYCMEIGIEVTNLSR